jgi:hypothetical protein
VTRHSVVEFAREDGRVGASVDKQPQTGIREDAVKSNKFDGTMYCLGQEMNGMRRGKMG